MFLVCNFYFYIFFTAVFLPNLHITLRCFYIKMDQIFTNTSLLLSVSFPEPQLANHSSEELFGHSEEESALSSVGERSTEVTVGAGSPSPTPSPTQAKDTNQTTKLFTPSKLSFSVGTFLRHKFLPADNPFCHSCLSCLSLSYMFWNGRLELRSIEFREKTPFDVIRCKFILYQAVCTIHYPPTYPSLH